MFAILVGCGGRVDTEGSADASSSTDGADTIIDGAADDAETAPALVAIDAASCATRPISLTCADGGVKDFLRMATLKCKPGCAAVVHVALDVEGCPTGVEVNAATDSHATTACVAPALSAQRWACGDAGTLVYEFGFGSCTN